MPDWANFKKELYKKNGLMLAFSQQGIYQHVSESLTEQHTAAAGWVLFEAKWEALTVGRFLQGRC